MFGRNSLQTIVSGVFALVFTIMFVGASVAPAEMGQPAIRHVALA